MTPDNAMMLAADATSATAAPPDTLRWLVSAARIVEENTSFDMALLCVSHCLVEAEACAEKGSRARARKMFSLAEACAIRSGYLELVRLVWAYDVPSNR